MIVWYEEETIKFNRVTNLTQTIFEKFCYTNIYDLKAQTAAFLKQLRYQLLFLLW